MVAKLVFVFARAQSSESEVTLTSIVRAATQTGSGGYAGPLLGAKCPA